MPDRMRFALRPARDMLIRPAGRCNSAMGMQTELCRSLMNIGGGFYFFSSSEIVSATNAMK
jgi:hypothetical protein